MLDNTYVKLLINYSVNWKLIHVTDFSISIILLDFYE